MSDWVKVAPFVDLPEGRGVRVDALGHRVALFRPITINPFPYAACREAMDGIAGGGPVLDIEMNMGQMIQDVKLAGEGSRRIEFLGTAGGIVPSPAEVADRIRAVLGSRERS